MRIESEHRERNGHRVGRRRGESEEKRHGAKTFRRGRALDFYEMVNTKSISLKKQLETPELISINPIIVSELKAVEAPQEVVSDGKIIKWGNKNVRTNS